jgi:ribosomal protein S18 acetylase RimI-like enzyme
MGISEARLSDLEALNMLVNSAYRGESSRKGWTSEAHLLDGLRTTPQDLQKLMDPPKSVMLKYEDEQGSLLGCVNLQQKSGKLYLGMLSVNPDRQSGGIGKMLLLAAEEYARQRELKVIQMTVISIRKELIEWYERRGYKDTGESVPFPDPDPSFGIARQPLEFIVMEKFV